MSESICNATAIELLGAHPAQVPDGARIDAIDVGRRVSGRQLLQNMSLSVEPGELVAIAGGSGAGKTTLLEILAGLRPPSAGELRHDGVVPRTRAGAGAAILAGVTIGPGAIIGARAVVASDVPPYAVVVGNPGRVARLRFSDRQIAGLLETAWWELGEDAVSDLLPLLMSGEVDALIEAARTQRLREAASRRKP